MKKWTKFVRDTTTDPVKLGGVLYSNNRYHVIVHRFRNKVPGGPDILHLSFRNNDRSAKRDWRDFQRIKNEFLGPEHEAIEIYPAESNLADLANQWHMWALEDPKWLSKLGLGFTDGRHLWDGVSQKPSVEGHDIAKSQQRPLSEEHKSYHQGNPVLGQMIYDRLFG
jgi:hypothetical protein